MREYRQALFYQLIEINCHVNQHSTVGTPDCTNQIIIDAFLETFYSARYAAANEKIVTTGRA